MNSPAHPTPRTDSPLLRVLPVVLAALVLSLLSPRSVARAPAPSPRALAHAAGVSGAAAPPAKWGHLPMRFEENAGQVDDQVRFVARGGGTTLFLTDEGATLTLHAPGAARSAQGPGSPRRAPHELARPAVEAPPRPDTVLRMTVAGGRRVAPRAEQKLITISNYFIGNDHSKWRTDIPNFGRVVYPGVLDGVDLVYHGEEGQLEYDFVVAPGADSSAIALDVSGAQELSLTDVGDLAIRTAHGVLVQPRPRVYQRGKSGETEEIAAGYRLIGERGVGFVVAAYDRGRELVIDPVLEYSTGFLSAWNFANAVAVDATRSAYVLCGSGATFPSVVKLTPAGDAAVYTTYLGSSEGSAGSGIAVDGAGSAYVTGVTGSDFPTQAAFQMAFGGGGSDAFVAKLSPSGSALAYSTYLGGAGSESGAGWRSGSSTRLAVDRTGSAFVVGSTNSTNFPTQNAFQPARRGGWDGFAAKLAPAGDSLTFSTYLGGSADDSPGGMALDGAGSTYVVGFTSSLDFPIQSALQTAHAGGSWVGAPPDQVMDAFVTKFSATGATLAYSTYLGGGGVDGADGIAVDASGSAYVAGFTGSADFPNMNPLQATFGGGSADAFVAKLTPSGGALGYATYLGGSKFDAAQAIVVDRAGCATVAVQISGSFKDEEEAHVARFSATGASLSHSTNIRGVSTPSAIAMDGSGNTYTTGTTWGAGALTLFRPLGFMEANEIREFGMGFIAKLSVPSPTLTPPTYTVAPGGTVTFAATDGTGPTYTFAFETNASGGTLDPVTGVYVAGPTGGVTDVVVVVDSQGGTATASVTVTSPVADAGPDATIVDASPDAAPVLDAGDAAAKDASPTADASSPGPTPAPSGDASAAVVPTGDSFGGGGCGCRTSGAPASGGAAGLGVLGVLALVARRRSRLGQDSRSGKGHS